MTRETTPAVERAARAAVAADPHLADVIIDGKVGAHTWETIPGLGQENYRVTVQAALTAALTDPNDPDALARTLFVIDVGVRTGVTAEGAVALWNMAPHHREHWRAVADGLRMMLTGQGS